MRRIWIVVLMAIAMVGCGGGGKGTPAGNGNPLDPQGNWAFTLTDSQGTPQSIVIAGQLFELNPPVVTSNGMAGHAGGAICDGSFFVSGQASGTNQITLTATQKPASQQTVPATFNLTGTIATDQAHMSGTWSAQSFDQGCGNLNTSGTWSAEVIQAMSGSWQGTLAEAAGKALNIGAALSLSEDTSQTSPNMGSLTGTLTITNSTCYSSPISITGSNPGFLVNLAGTAADGSKIGIAGTIDVTATHFTITSLTVTGGACDGQNFAGTVTR